MPNPGAMTSMQAFDRESINTVIHIPDYKLRQHLSLQQNEALVLEAFVAFDEMFYLNLRWSDGGNYPEILLSSVGARYHKLVLDLNVQSPHFTYSAGEGAYSVAAPQWVPCTWSTPKTPMEVRRPSSVVPLSVDRSPTYHNDINISMEQTVTFTLIATMWELDDSPISSLHCRSYRARVPTPSGEPGDTPARMIACLAATRGAPDVPTDICLQLDDEFEGSTTHCAHAFLLQAQSPVFRRMLAGPMVEATQRTVKMAGLSARELTDFLSALYQFGVPADVRDDDDRLCNLLSLADRYEVIPLRDECAHLLEARLSESNMGTILRVAELHQATSLRATALDFVTSHIDRIATVMDSDEPALRKAVREHVAMAEAFYKAHIAAADLKPLSDTLTV